MKTILVPTDFSENAENALYYAIELAKREAANILLLNAYNVNYEASETEESDLAEAIAISNTKLKGMAVKIEHAGGIRYELMSIAGSPVNAILSAIKEKKVDLVVMGSRGETNLFSVVFGSTTANVMSKADCPVIAVPLEASVAPIKKITYATNYHQSDIRALQKLQEIAKPYSAQVNLLHISSDDVSPVEEKLMMENFMKEVTGKMDYTNLSFQLLCSNDLTNELREYIEGGNTDLLVMSTHHGGIIDKLFGESITREVSKFSTIPIMSFHHNKHAAVKIFI